MNPIKIKNLSWAYDQRMVLDNIDLKIDKGFFTGIIGPNGSGKTTLAKTITKLLDVKDDIIYINDVDIHNIKYGELAKEMALVPQVSEINYDLTVYEVVLLGRTPHLSRFQRPSEKDFNLVKEVMTETDTWQYKDRLIHQLSGGERQRVIIARALAQSPTILILDEPVTYLDVHHQIQVMNLIKKLSLSREMTIVMILHDLNYALKYCDQVILLNQGHIDQYGKPEAVITEENIQRVYGIDVSIIKHPKTNQSLVVY